jgi:hypothetical protein
MSRPDWESIAKIIDDADTQWAVDDTLNSSNLDALINIVDQIRPHLLGEGNQEDVTNAIKYYRKIRNMMGREIGGSADDETDIDTTTCQLCGEKFTGTKPEIDEWEGLHLKTKHPERLG